MALEVKHNFSLQHSHPPLNGNCALGLISKWKRKITPLKF